MSEERLQKILRLIESSRTITAKELESQLYVSSATIRRDLAELSRRGLIVRSHGKAMAVTRMAHAVTHGEPVQPDDPIAAAAAALVKPHSTIFIAAGRFSRSLAKAVSRVADLTVVTDSLAAADALCGHAAHVHCTGGHLQSGDDALSGSQAAELAGLFYTHMAFFSGDALTEGGDITFYNADRMSVLRTAVRHAEKRVLLFSGKQINAEPGSSLLHLKDMDFVVTDIPGYFSTGYHGTVIGAGE